MLEVEPEFLAMTVQMPSGCITLHHKIDFDRMAGVAQRKLLYSRGPGCIYRRKKR
jgi:hypothetical protein